MTAVEEELVRDGVTQAVALAVTEHFPEATATEAYYRMVMGHVAELLWNLGAGRHALAALDVVLRKAVTEMRGHILDASAETRKRR